MRVDQFISGNLSQPNVERALRIIMEFRNALRCQQHGFLNDVRFVDSLLQFW